MEDSEVVCTGTAPEDEDSAPKDEESAPKDETGRPIVVLLLTACVDVGDCILLARRDPALRRADYASAAERFVKTTDYPIVWVENSGADTAFMAELATRLDATDRLEILSFRGNDTAGRYGKGHSEREAVRYALANSRYRHATRHWAKITGRLFVPNLKDIVEATVGMRPDLQVAVMNDRVGVVRHVSGSLAHPSMLFIFTERFFETHFLHQRIDDKVLGYYFEDALGCAVDELLKKEGPGAVGHFVGARFEGINGTTNVDIAHYFGRN